MTTIAAATRGAATTAFPVRWPLRELTERALLDHLPLAAVLVDDRGDVLYVHGRTGMFLEPAPGDAGTFNVLKMAREGLRRDLATALHKARATRETVRRAAVRVKTNGHFTAVNLAVRPVVAGPVKSVEPTHYLVILEDAGSADLKTATPNVASSRAGARARARPDAEARIESLTKELRTMEEYLLSANQEREASKEELKSSNEEMQSVNEELQSTNEEMETSKEELQSVNEELATVNAELQTKLTDLSRVNNDMNNLLAGTGIGTVFVDRQLRILRFTPAATAIIHLIPSDVGRPVAHLVSNLVGYDHLVADVQTVLDTLATREVEVQTTAGKWYAMRIQPYRTTENVIEGVVISFLDITETVRTRERLGKANELLRMAVVVRDAHDAITVQDLDGRILAWNPGATRMYGWSEAEALQMNVRDRIPQALREGALAKLRQLSRAEILEPYHTQRLTKGGAILEVSIISSALVNEAGDLYAIATTERTYRAAKALPPEGGAR